MILPCRKTPCFAIHTLFVLFPNHALALAAIVTFIVSVPLRRLAVPRGSIRHQCILRRWAAMGLSCVIYDARNEWCMDMPVGAVVAWVDALGQVQ